MGKILDNWMARNSGYLATLVPGGGTRQPTAFAPQPDPQSQPMPGFAGAPGAANGSSFGAPVGPSSFAAPPLQATQVTPQAPPTSGMVPPSGPTRTSGGGKNNYGV
jgi:hypothetical protein